MTLCGVESSPGAFSAKIGVRGGTKGGIWKTWDKMQFDYIFLATGDGSDWFVPRGAVRDHIRVCKTGKNKEYEFGWRKPAAPACAL